MSGLRLWFSHVFCLCWFLICTMLIHFISFCNIRHTYIHMLILYIYNYIYLWYNIYRYIHTYYILLYPTISYYILLYPTTSYYILLHPTLYYYILLHPTISYYIPLYPIIYILILLYILCNLHILNWRHGSSAWTNASPRTAEARARSSDKGIALDDYRWGHVAMSCSGKDWSIVVYKNM